MKYQKYLFTTETTLKIITINHFCASVYSIQFFMINDIKFITNENNHMETISK